MPPNKLQTTLRQTSILQFNCETILWWITKLRNCVETNETHGVTWGDVDWQRKRLRVYAPKTKSVRIVPVVPALLTLLQDGLDAAEEGATAIVTLSRNNLHRSFLAIQARSGVVEWDDLFQMLHRSCESDFAKRHPQHAVSRWIGHSMKVSEKHYLMVDDDVFEATSNDPVLRAAATPRISSHSVAGCSESLSDSQLGAQTEARTMPMVATSCGLLREVDRGGIEPPTPGFSVGLSSRSDSLLTNGSSSGCDSSGNGDETGAQQKAQHEGQNLGRKDDGLARLNDAWPGLTAAKQQMILDLLDSLLSAG